MANLKTKSLVEINEAGIDTQANIYADKYRDQVDNYEAFSIKTKVNESLSPYEIVALGQQLDQFTQYTTFCESQGTLGSLGNMPQIALDVITASVGSSILPLISSIQPMSEEHGIVYYRQMRAMQTDGGYNTGDVIDSPLQRDNPGDGTLGGNRKLTNLVNLVAGTLTYSGNLPAAPVRPYLFNISIAGIGQGKDDGNGTLLGFGMSGTINYTTGVWSVTLALDPAANIAAAPGGVLPLQAMYDLDTDGLAALDKVQGQLQTKDIRAQIWALAADVGAFANFAFTQRFGRSAIDEVATDLTNELTRILNTNAINQILANIPAGSLTTWSKANGNLPGPSTASYAENKLTFIDAIANAEMVLHSQSGAPTANRYLVGKLAAATLRGMPDFTPAPDAANVSVGLFGYYDGIPVIRATGVIADYDMILLSNAGNYFNAPLAYAPFMPLMITNTVQSPNNPFRQTTAAGTWAGMTALNGNLSTRLTITA